MSTSQNPDRSSTTPNRTDDAELRAKFALVGEYYGRTYKELMANFPGWMRPAITEAQHEEGESRTAFRERRLARDAENANIRERQDAWYAVHGDTLDDAAVDAQEECTKKGKGKAAPAPAPARPKPVQAKAGKPVPVLGPIGLMPPPGAKPKRPRVPTFSKEGPRKRHSRMLLSSSFASGKASPDSSTRGPVVPRMPIAPRTIGESVAASRNTRKEREKREKKDKDEKDKKEEANRKRQNETERKAKVGILQGALPNGFFKIRSGH